MSKAMRRKYRKINKIKLSCLQKKKINFLWGVRRANNSTVEEISNKNERDVKGMVIGDSRTNLKNSK